MEIVTTANVLALVGGRVRLAISSLASTIATNVVHVCSVLVSAMLHSMDHRVSSAAAWVTAMGMDIVAKGNARVLLTGSVKVAAQKWRSKRSKQNLCKS